MKITPSPAGPSSRPATTDSAKFEAEETSWSTGPQPNGISRRIPGMGCPSVGAVVMGRERHGEAEEQQPGEPEAGKVPLDHAPYGQAGPKARGQGGQPIGGGSPAEEEASGAEEAQEPEAPAEEATGQDGVEECVVGVTHEPDLVPHLVGDVTRPEEP